MKIQGPSKSQGTDKSKKSGKTSKGDGTFGNMVADAAGKSAAPSGVGPVSKVDSLLAVQAAESSTEGKARRRMQARGDKILRQLDLLRLGMLTGQMTAGDMLDIAETVAAHRENIDDPELSAVLDEIDLRAQIELAKLRKAGQS